MYHSLKVGVIATVLVKVGSEGVREPSVIAVEAITVPAIVTVPPGIDDGTGTWAEGLLIGPNDCLRIQLLISCH